MEKTSGSIFDAPAFQTTQSNDVIESKGITVWAVAALVVAALSLLAFVHLAFLALSVIAILFSLVAFLTIWKGGGEVAGKRLAIVALALATLTAIGGPVRRVVYRIAFERQAAEFCEVWFDAAKRGDVCQIRQMTQPHWRRATIATHKDEVDYFVRDKMGDEEPHYKTHAFLANSTLLTLAKLGDRAKHSFYCAPSTWLTSSIETTERIYAVTVEPDPAKPDDKKQTFFLSIVCTRDYGKTEEGERLVGWKTNDADLEPLKLDKTGAPIYRQEDM